MRSKQRSPAGDVAKQKGRVPKAELTGHLRATVWCLQLPAAISASSVAVWQALTAALHTTSAPFCIAHLPVEPAALEKDGVRRQVQYATTAKLKALRVWRSMIFQLHATAQNRAWKKDLVQATLTRLNKCQMQNTNAENDRQLHQTSCLAVTEVCIHS